MITRVNVGEISLLFSNPPSRVDPLGLRELQQYAEGRVALGQEAFRGPDRIVLGRDGKLGDGHRRYAVMKILGITECEAEIDEEKNGAEIWRDRNSGKPLNTRQETEALRLGHDLAFVTPRTRKNAEKIMKMAGQDGYELVVASGMSLGLEDSLGRALRFMNRNGDLEWGYTTLAWIIKHKMQRTLRHAIEDGKYKPSQLIKAIQQDRAIRYS